jgi:DNA primase/energy-coupling factor transporter ATP-binding protein EcfA2
MEIQEIKQHLTMSTVLQKYNLKPDKNHRLCCPFHEDKTPSMQVYYKTQTAYCFSSNCPTHGKSLDVIDFIMKKESITKHEAILKAQDFIGNPNLPQPQPKPKPKPDKPEPTTEERAAFLNKMFTYFKNAVYNSKPAQQYITGRKLDYTKLEIGYNSGQFHHGTRKDEALIKQCLETGLLNDNKLIARTGEPAYSVFGKCCIVFALKGKQNQITSLYFRSTINDKEQRHFYLKDRSGLYPHYPKPTTKRLILTEAIIDAASLLQILETLPKQGSRTPKNINEGEQITAEYEILSCYGTNGLTEEHKAAIKELHQLEEIILFYDGDQAGKEAINKHSELLHQLRPEIKLTYIETPENEDINSLWQGHESELFTNLIENRKTAPPNLPKGEALEENSTQTTLTPSPSGKAGMGLLETYNPYNLYYNGLAARYFVKGGIRPQLDSMRISLQIIHPQTNDDYRTKLDLYEFKQVSSTSTAAAEKLGIRADLVEKDLSRLTTLLEEYRDNRPNTGTDSNDQKRIIKVPEATAGRCIAFLQKPGLVASINTLIEKAGVTGEETNRILLFVVASSYKMPDTLHALVQGSSGSGKTHLILKVAELMPPEDCITLTRVTDSSFYNYAENDLVNKLICMEDLDGMKEDAFLAFRELQSRGMLTSSTSVKDENGNIRGMVKLVKGPVASLSATTKGEIYEDNMSRCFLVAVDESNEQSQRIIKHQNNKAAGLVDTTKESELKAFIQNCIRLLKPHTVINPYAKLIELPEEAHKIRRLNELYQSFVKQVTLLNQHQRKKDEQNRLIAEKEDLQTACEILFESIILKVDELDGSLRQFYEQLKTYIQKHGGDYKDYQFTGREIRQEFKISKTQMFRYINDLIELEYINQTGGYANKGFKYKISYWDDVQALRQRIRSHLQSQIDKL